MYADMARSVEALRVAQHTIQLHYVLHVFETTLFYCLSKEFTNAHVNVAFLKSWLWKHEGGVGTLCNTMPRFSKHYDMARIQRGFLHDILQGVVDSMAWQPQQACRRRVAILGSYPMHHFAHSPTMANDVDVFVQNKAIGQQLVVRYQQLMLMVLGAYTKVAHNNSSMAPTLTNSHHALSDICGAWPRAMNAFLQEATSDEDNILYLDAVEDTLNHLPQYTRSAFCFVQHTWRVTVHQHATGRPLVAPWRPLNVVCMCALPDSGFNSFRDIVADSFDLQHCLVSLRITGVGLYEYDMSQCTRTCVLQKKLLLRPTAFRGETAHDAIVLQLHRVLKYLKRGYTW